MTTIGYIRVSIDHQDLEKQRHLLLAYSQQHRLLIDEFIAVEIFPEWGVCAPLTGWRAQGVVFAPPACSEGVRFIIHSCRQQYP